MPVFRFLAVHGRWVLIAGLALGIASPDLAIAARATLPVFIFGLIFLAALRIGPAAAIDGGRGLPQTVGLVLLFQIVVPIAVWLATTTLGAPPLWVFTLTMLTASATVTGAPNLTILLGHRPVAALRLLVVGTLLLPLTVLAVFPLLPQVGEGGGVLAAALNLLAIVLSAAGSAFLVRRFVWPELSADATTVVDGASSLLMAILVIALMSAFGPALLTTPLDVAGILALAFAINFGMQILAWAAMRAAGRPHDAVAVAMVSGNRNMALFLAALPPAVMDPMLLFIGCYQLPMYLTPLLLGRLYGRPTPSG